MNWYSVVKLALALFIVQVTVGFLDGFIITPGVSLYWHFAGHAASFVACSAVFAFFAMRNLVKPFPHAWLGLILQILIGLIFFSAFSAWLGDVLWVSIALEWAVLILALSVGTSIGIGVRHSAGKPSDA